MVVDINVRIKQSNNTVMLNFNLQLQVQFFAVAVSVWKLSSAQNIIGFWYMWELHADKSESHLLIPFTNNTQQIMGFKEKDHGMQYQMVYKILCAR